MKKSFILMSIIIFNLQSFANCFIAKEKNLVIEQEGICSKRYSPASTFKIAISLMGYNENILIDEEHPKLPFKKGYFDRREKWKQSHTPSLWMKNSCAWYSQVLTSKIGMEKFKEYLAKFHYGNQDVSGDKGKNNGLTRSWLSSSLEISPEEQTIFLQNLIDDKLLVSPKAHEMTKNIIFVEELLDGWKLYGKTGFCSVLSEDSMQTLDGRHNEWFVGWIEKDHDTIVFASYLEHSDKYYNPANKEAKVVAKEKLQLLINNRKSIK